MTYFVAQPVWFTVVCAVLLVLLYVGFVPLGYPGRIDRRYGTKIPEAHWLYSRRDVEEFLRRLGPGGLQLYRLQLWWDIPFAILLAAPMVAILDATWATSLDDASPFRILVFTPIVYAVVDIIEDALLLTVTSHVRFKTGETEEQAHQEPCADPELLGLGSLIAAQAATALKFLAVGGSLALVLVGGVKHVVDASPALKLSTYDRGQASIRGWELRLSRDKLQPWIWRLEAVACR